MSVPGLKVVAPATPSDAYGTLVSAVYDNNPVLFVEHKLLYNIESEIDTKQLKAVPLGKARVAKEGRHVTIVSHSYGVELSLAAARELEIEGIDAEVIDLRTLKPLDIETIEASVRKTGRLVCVEEGDKFGGVGSEVLSSVVEQTLPYIDGRVLRVGKPQVPIPASMEAEKYVLPDIEEIKDAVKKSLSWK